MSAFFFLRIGLNEPGYSHFMSFRRQIFINLDDITQFPKIIQIPFEDTIYNIYSSSDLLVCYTCHKEGHIAKVCPGNPLIYNTEISRTPEENTRMSNPSKAKTTQPSTETNLLTIVSIKTLPTMPPPKFTPPFPVIKDSTKRSLHQSTSTKSPVRSITTIKTKLTGSGIGNTDSKATIKTKKAKTERDHIPSVQFDIPTPIKEELFKNTYKYPYDFD